MKLKRVTRHQIKVGSSTDITAKYFVKTVRKEEVLVCLNAFITILKVSRFWLNQLAKQYFHVGVEEKSGGFRKSSQVKYKTQRTSIVNFFNSLTYADSHYCRNQSQRKYLPPELNVSKLYRK